MSQLSSLLSEARATAYDTSQDEHILFKFEKNVNFFEIQTKGFRYQCQLDH